MPYTNCLDYAIGTQGRNARRNAARDYLGTHLTGGEWYPMNNWGALSAGVFTLFTKYYEGKGGRASKVETVFETLLGNRYAVREAANFQEDGVVRDDDEPVKTIYLGEYNGNETIRSDLAHYFVKRRTGEVRGVESQLYQDVQAAQVLSATEFSQTAHQGQRLGKILGVFLVFRVN